jgi:hypothetical protein
MPVVVNAPENAVCRVVSRDDQAIAGWHRGGTHTASTYVDSEHESYLGGMASLAMIIVGRYGVASVDSDHRVGARTQRMRRFAINHAAARGVSTRNIRPAPSPVLMHPSLFQGRLQGSGLVG